MDEQEKLQLIEDVCLNIRWNLHRYWTGDMEYCDVMDNVKMEVGKLEALELDEHKPPSMDAYLLTAPNCGPKAYLCKSMENSWVVQVDGYNVTAPYPQPKTALDEYVSQSKNDDFIDDFLVGVEDGTCEFGDSDYAVYVEKCFNSYVFGKGL